jgi:hypothetical protein
MFRIDAIFPKISNPQLIESVNVEPRHMDVCLYYSEAQDKKQFILGFSWIKSNCFGAELRTKDS